ncbi:ribonuclease H-like domain-containing protein [Tanacetum coccineum]
MSQPANDDFSQHLSDDEASYHEDASENGTATNKPKQQQQQQLIPTTTTISNIKLPILKKEEYDIWAMEMEHYLEYIDNDVWKVIQNGNSKKRISTGKDGVVRILPPVSAAEIHVVEKERKARTILLIDIPKEHLRRFHGMDDAKEIWEAIRTRFGGNANSKKMQKAILKQQFKAFTISSSEGLEKGYDSKSSNNKVKSSYTGPYSTYTPSTSSNNIPEQEVPADLDLLIEDLEQIDDIDIEEMDINWQIAMIAIRMKKFYKKTGRRVWIDGNKPVGFDKKKLECFKCHNTGHFARECPSKGQMMERRETLVIKIKEMERKEQNQNCFAEYDMGPQKHEISDSDDNPMSILPVNQMTVKDLLEIPLSTLLRIILLKRHRGQRLDNGTEFKNRDMLEFCGNKGIKQEYSNARTPQQNGVAERMNKTLIEAARTMLADSLLPTTFWAEAVNTLSVLGKFDGKCDEGFLVGYSLNSKAFRVYNLVTKKVEVNLHVKFLEEKPNVKGVGYRWMFDIDYLTDSMNYIPVSLENQTNQHAGTSEVTNPNAGTSEVTTSAGTLQTPNANASEEEDEAEDLIIVPQRRQVGPREGLLLVPQAWSFLKSFKNLKTQEKEAYSTGISEDTPEILAFGVSWDDLAQKHLREVPKNKDTNTNLVNFGSGIDDAQPADQDDSDFGQRSQSLTKPQQGMHKKVLLVVREFLMCISLEEELKKISTSSIQDGQFVLKLWTRGNILQFRLQSCNSFFECLHYKLLEDVVNNIFGIILELQPFELITT